MTNRISSKLLKNRKGNVSVKVVEIGHFRQ